MTKCLYCGSKDPVKFELCQNCLDNIGFGVKFNQEVEILDELLIACEYKSFCLLYTSDAADDSTEV